MTRTPVLNTGSLASKTGVQNSTYVYAADAEASDSYAITLSPAPSAYAAGQKFSFKANTANTGSASLNVNGLGAKTIKKFTDQDLETGDVEVGSILLVEYDGTNFQLLSSTATGERILWTEIASGGSASMTPNANYLVDGGVYSTQTLTLPAVSAVGDIIRVKTKYSNGAGSTTKIAQGAGQAILFNAAGGQTSTTVGTSGFIQTTRMATVTLICTVANTTWQIVDQYAGWTDQSSTAAIITY